VSVEIYNALQPGEQINNLEQALLKDSRETNHAKIRDLDRGNDGVCGIIVVSSGQCRRELWAEQGRKSVLHGFCHLGA
jgi:hypothetical protein